MATAHAPHGRKLLGFSELYALLVGVVALLLFSFSSMLLTHLGFNYGSTGGSALEKVHPGTVFAMGLLIWTALALGPGRFLATIHARSGAVLIAFACFAVFSLYVIVALALPFTFVIDTLFLPLVMFALLSNIREADRDLMGAGLHVFMSVNAAIAVVEMIFSVRLVPYYLEEGAISWDWRSTGLLGHPLGNANLTAVYIALLAFGGGRLTPAWRGLLIVTQLAAMASFGGRAATATAVMVLGCSLFARAALLLAQGRITSALVMRTLVAAAALALIALVLMQAGFFDRFIDRASDDQGSADTRVRMFELFNYFDFEEMLLGPNGAVLATLSREYGLDYGIESFVIAYLLRFGVFASGMVFFGLFALGAGMTKSRGWRGALGLAVFLGINVTSLGISAKTIILGQFIVMA
ncbi:MAG: VpsF family polysaccharide biosynthesis protein, partial [Beijerinckiaceae bacterium]